MDGETSAAEIVVSLITGLLGESVGGIITILIQNRRDETKLKREKAERILGILEELAIAQLRT